MFSSSKTTSLIQSHILHKDKKYFFLLNQKCRALLNFLFRATRAHKNPTRPPYPKKTAPAVAKPEPFGKV
jgi:hypothetical protein